jgi:hypothetical protein
MTWFIRIADAQTRLQGLLKEFPALPPQSAELAIQADPTPNKQYARSILIWLRGGSVRLPEDGPRLNKALSFFSANLRKLQIKDINQYRTFNDLEGAIDQLQGVDLRSKRRVTQDIKVQGSQEVFNANGWRVLKMTTPEAVCQLGQGTKWCTTSDEIDEDTGQTQGFYTAQSYLKSGPLYLFMYEDGGKWIKFAQATQDLSQVMDVMDRPIQQGEPAFVAILKELVKSGVFRKEDFRENYLVNADYPGIDEDFVEWYKEEDIANSGEAASVLKTIINNADENKTRYPAVEDKIVFAPTVMEQRKMQQDSTQLMDGDRIEDYFGAVNWNRHRWPNKEPQILSSTFANNYWQNFFNREKFKRVTGDTFGLNRWPEYEQAMLTNPKRAEEMVNYLWHVNGPKRAEPQFEKYLLECAKNTHEYDPCFEYCDKSQIRRWPELEAILLADHNRGMGSWDMILYAQEVLKGRWEEAEQYILQDTPSASRYAAEVLRQRWPELEDRIMERQDGWSAATYAINVLRQRWPAMEPYIMNYGIQQISNQYKKVFNLDPWKELEREASNMSWYKRAQTLTPQQVNQYRMFRTPHGVTVKGTGLSANFTVPGTNQTISGQDIMNRVVAKLQKVLNDNGVHTIDTGGIAQQDALGLAVSTQPGTVHVDIARVFNEAQQQAFPSTTEMDGVELDPDLSNDIVEKITKILEHEIGNTTAHESQHNRDYLDTFPTGKFESPESGAEAFGNQMANQYFKL